MTFRSETTLIRDSGLFRFTISAIPSMAIFWERGYQLSVSGVNDLFLVFGQVSGQNGKTNAVFYQQLHGTGLVRIQGKDGSIEVQCLEYVYLLLRDVAETIVAHDGRDPTGSRVCPGYSFLAATAADQNHAQATQNHFHLPVHSCQSFLFVFCQTLYPRTTA